MRRLLILCGLILWTLDVFSCECIPVISLEEHFKKADIVFYGKVKSINDSQIDGFRDNMNFMMDSLYTDRGGYHPTIEIKKVFKGKKYAKPQVDIISNWSLCDVFFKKDSEYVVFGYFDQNEQIQTNICVPTSMVTDKEFLRRIEKMK